jgi:hypothetical protein
MTSATLDSNMYISALEFGGVGARFLAVIAGQIRLGRIPPAFTRSTLASLANVVIPKATLNVISDPDDDRILECAVEAMSDCIVTRDRHLLTIKELSGYRDRHA